ncbi:MAG: CoA-binding protein, partial [Bacteroidetes bacterium]
MASRLQSIFAPQAVAIFGISNTPQSVGYRLMHHLANSSFDGIFYPVSRTIKSVMGIRCYASLQDIPDPVDLALVASPLDEVPDLVTICAKAGVGGMVVMSKGFEKADDPAAARQAQQVRQLARVHRIRIIGPGSLGVMIPRLGLNASLLPQMPEKGRVAFISQSRSLCTTTLDWARRQRVGISHFISTGSMADVGFHDLIDYLGSDPHTSCILIYMQSLAEARPFMSAARAFARNKPIIVLKAGKSEAGSQLTLSHTGVLAGNDAAFDAAFRRAGILRVDTIQQMFNLAQALAMQKRPQNKRLAIVTNAGGPGVLATDHLVRQGGKLANFSQETCAKLTTLLPAGYPTEDPLDLHGDATPERYREAIATCLRCPDADGVLVIYAPQANNHSEAIAQDLVQLARKSKKTVLAAWLGESEVAPARDLLFQGHIPNYRYPEAAVDVFLKMYESYENIQLLYELPDAIPEDFSPDTELARSIIEAVRSDGRQRLTAQEARHLLGAYQIPVQPTLRATSPEEAAGLARDIGFPVAMKVASQDIPHRTEAGGVRLHITDEAAARQAYTDILETVSLTRPEAEIRGVLVEPMAVSPYELFIGSKKDETFGPVVVFGMGGVAVEIFRDKALGLPPLNMALAHRLMRETTIYQLLKGYRGMPEVDLTEVQYLLYKFAYLVMDFPDIKEVDINPLMVGEQGSVVLDAKVRLDVPQPQPPGQPYHHLVISPYPRQYARSVTLSDRQVAT